MNFEKTPYTVWGAGIVLIMMVFLFLYKGLISKDKSIEQNQKYITDISVLEHGSFDRLAGEIRLESLIDEISCTRVQININRKKKYILISVPLENELLFRQVFFNSRNKENFENRSVYLENKMFNSEEEFGLRLGITEKNGVELVEIPWEVLYSLLLYNNTN